MYTPMKAVTSNSTSDIVTFFLEDANRTITIAGTWDTATVTLSASPDGGTTWVALTGGAFTADTLSNFTLARGYSLKGVVSSVGAGTILSMWVSE